MSLADKCIVVGCFVCGDYDKILMETGKFSDNIENNPPYRDREPTANQSKEVLKMQNTNIFGYKTLYQKYIATSARVGFAPRSLYSRSDPRSE